MEAILIAINKVLDIKIVQWGLLITVAVVIPYLTLKVYWYKYDNALLKSTVGDISEALHKQNAAIAELGIKANQLKANYEQANKRAAKIALESKRKFEELEKTRLVGSCDEKVKQAGIFVRESVK